MDKAVEAVKARGFSTVAHGKGDGRALLDLVRGGRLRQRDAAQPGSPAWRRPSRELLTIQPWDKGPPQGGAKRRSSASTWDSPLQRRQPHPHPAPPRSTKRRRRELVKVVHKFSEEGRVAIRRARTDAIRQDQEDRARCPRIEKKHTEKDIQSCTTTICARWNEAVKAKEAEIMRSEMADRPARSDPPQ